MGLKASQDSRDTQNVEMTTGVDPQLITVEEAGVLLEKSTATIWRRIREGKLRRHEVLGRTLVERAQVETMKKEAVR